MTKKKHHGSSFESFLEEEGILEEVSLAATKKVIAALIAAEMKKKGLTKTAMAEKMDKPCPTRSSARSRQRLATLKRAAKTLGKSLRLELA